MLLIRKHETGKQLWTGILNRGHHCTSNEKRMTICQPFCQGGDLREMGEKVHNPRRTEPVIKIIKHRGVRQVNACISVSIRRYQAKQLCLWTLFSRVNVLFPACFLICLQISSPWSLKATLPSLLHLPWKAGNGENETNMALTARDSESS